MGLDVPEVGLEPPWPTGLTDTSGAAMTPLPPSLGLESDGGFADGLMVGVLSVGGVGVSLDGVTVGAGAAISGDDVFPRTRLIPMIPMSAINA
jgi:hypothetical protein